MYTGQIDSNYRRNDSSKQRRNVNMTADIAHFDHDFPCALAQITPEDCVPERSEANHSPKLLESFGRNARVCVVIFSKDELRLQEEVGTTIASLKERVLCTIRYEDIKEVGWDHQLSKVRISSNAAVVLILDLLNSLELERELVLRLKSMQQTALRKDAPPKFPEFGCVVCSCAIRTAVLTRRFPFLCPLAGTWACLLSTSPNRFRENVLAFLCEWPMERCLHFRPCEHWP